MKTVITIMALLLIAQTTSPQIPHSVPPGTNDSPEFHTGNDLLRKCQGKVYDDTYCLAYIIGALDMIGALEGTVDLQGKSYWKYAAVCMPSQAEAGQVRDVVVKYLVDHPDKRDQRAAQIVLIALVETWKCPGV